MRETQEIQFALKEERNHESAKVQRTLAEYAEEFLNDMKKLAENMLKLLKA